MTQPTAMVTAFLAWSLLAFPTGYSKSDNTAEAEQAVRWGAEYLLKLFMPTVGSTYGGGATIIYQVSLSVVYVTLLQTLLGFHRFSVYNCKHHTPGESQCLFSYVCICQYGANTVRLSAFLRVRLQASYTR